MRRAQLAAAACEPQCALQEGWDGGEIVAPNDSTPSPARLADRIPACKPGPLCGRAASGSKPPHRPLEGGGSNALAESQSAQLARFVARLRWADLPGAVRHEAKRALVNYFAVALGGCREPAVDVAARVFSALGSSGPATVIGRGERFDALRAAGLNAMSANVFDFDDTHLPTVIHPTAPVAPALFALAELTSKTNLLFKAGALTAATSTAGPITGEQLLLAFVAGVEIECRLGRAMSPGHYTRGWHITSTCGIFGAAIATGKALGLDAQALVWALGHASAQASGLVQTLGTAAKSSGVGHAASAGLLAALLAQQGSDGPDEPLGGALGGALGYLRVAADAVDLAALTDGLGTHWELLSNAYKPYPCGVVLNPVIEACLALRNEIGPAWLDIGGVAQITLTGHPLLRARTDRPAPPNGRLAQVSAQHAVAVALLRGRAGLAEFSDEAVADPAVRALGGRVVFVDDAGGDVDAASVSVVMADGRSHSHTVGHARGGLTHPLSDNDLDQKLITLAAHGRWQGDTAALLAALWGLEHSADAAQVMALAAAT